LNENTVFVIKDGIDKTEPVIIQNYSVNIKYTLTICPEAGATEVILRSVNFSEIIKLDSANCIIING
jgi:hypothetical protein